MSYSGALSPLHFLPWYSECWVKADGVCGSCPADKDQSHVIGGLKATISNPKTSTEAKEHAAERLEELAERTHSSPPHEPPHHELGTHQIAGYKATITSSWDFLDLVSCYLRLGYRPQYFGQSEGTRS